MSQTVISVENVSKSYRLGQIGGGTIREDFARWCAKLQGKADPNLKIGQEHHARLIGQVFWALQDVSFKVQQGEIVGIIGRNGAGKSTLLKILSQVTTPTAGQIKIKGRIASLLEVGTGFHPELTGRENIFLNGAILGMTKAEIRRKFDEIVAFSGVEEFIDTPVKRYSSGMYVRLAFAVAAHLEPEILIVDEVLAVGDAEFQKKCLGKMKDVSTKEGRTVLFVSHNMGAISTLCSKSVLLKAGSVERCDTTQNVISYYLDTQSRSSSHEIKDLRSGSTGEEIRFLSIQLAGQSDSVDYGLPVVIELEIQSDRDFENLSLGASIFCRDGDPVGTLFTNTTFDILSGQRKKLRLTIAQFNLAPGNYYAGFSIGTGGFSSQRYDYDIVIGAPSFTINERSESGLLGSWHPSWGSIHLANNRLETIESPSTK